MGMAASQARFLSLTARKSNVEWEGQQVNQQRTALANESANLYNQLNALEVPTPPSVKDYTKTVYTFSTNELDNNTQDKGNSDYKVTNIYSYAGGTYATVEHTVPYWDYATTSLYNGSITEDAAGNVTVNLNTADEAKNAKKYTYEPTGFQMDVEIPDITKSITIPDIQGTFQLNSDGSRIEWTNGSDSASYEVMKLSNGKYRITVKEETDDNNSAQAKVNFAGNTYNVLRESATGNFKVYTESGVLAKGLESAFVQGSYKSGNSIINPEYFDSSFYNYTNSDKSTAYYQPIVSYEIANGAATSTYYVNAACSKGGEGTKSFSASYYLNQLTRTAKKDYPCTTTTNANGRIEKISLTDDYGTAHTFSLGIQSEEDEAGYKQAMLDYEYEQAKYQKKVKDINAKTEKIQQEDRTLELRLKQLDTEQNALKTEMDAVSKVIEDNIESTFKTFA